MSRHLRPRDIVKLVRQAASSARPLVLLGLAASLAACDAASGPGDRTPVTLSFAATPIDGALASVGESPRAPGAALDVSLGDGTHTLVLSSVELVLDEVELERAGVDAECLESEDGSRDGHGSDDCHELESGPSLVALPLDGASAPIVTPISVPVPAGRYESLELKVRPANPNSHEDAAFLAAHPDLRGVSVRVRGTFDGEPFEFTSPTIAEAELEFVTPLEVGADGVNITVNIDVTTWFRDASGALVDPRTASFGQPNFSLVSFNIWQSFRVYEDDDRDGHDDHGGHGGDDPSGDDHGSDS